MLTEENWFEEENLLDRCGWCGQMNCKDQDCVLYDQVAAELDGVDETLSGLILSIVRFRNESKLLYGRPEEAEAMLGVLHRKFLDASHHCNAARQAILMAREELEEDELRVRRELFEEASGE